MSRPLLEAQHYHDQANRLRELAAHEDKDNLRGMLLQLANSYDRLSARFIRSVSSMQGAPK